MAHAAAVKTSARRPAGKTVRELQDKIAAMLADGYIKNPVVRAEIDKYKASTSRSSAKSGRPAGSR
jgi:hypothetical protein